MEKRYLIYRSWNGKVHASIENGDFNTKEGRLFNDASILKKIELLDHNLTLSQAIKLYPYGQEIVRQ